MDSQGEGDAFLVLPVRADGMEFVSVGYWGHATFFSAILVIASAPATELKIFKLAFNFFANENLFSILKSL